MITYPNAKINLGLAIMRKREDGYHDLETIFLPVSELHDELEVTVRSKQTRSQFSEIERGNTSDEKACLHSRSQSADVSYDQPYTFTQEGIEVDCPASDNLVIKTYLLMREKYAKVGEVDIHFKKNIPFGAGLGGGSADAAFMAMAINELFELGLGTEELEEIMSTLGADCAFFVQNRPRVATGIGNVFSEVDNALLEALDGMYMVLVKPECAVSTGEAYRGIVPREKSGQSSMLESVSKTTNIIEKLALLTNDFEQTIFPKYPEIEDVKQRLQDLGAAYSSMSGSGASVFGLFQENVPSIESYFPNCFVHMQLLHF